MSSTSSHQPFHWHNLFMHHSPTPVESPASVEQPGTDGQNEPSIDSASTQATPELILIQSEVQERVTESIIVETEAPEQAAKPTYADVQEEYSETSTKGMHVNGQNISGASAEYVRGNLLTCGKARLIVNSRAGQNFKKTADVLTVFSAAGWKTDIVVKMYGGHAVELATKAVEQKCDVVIAYGGDGTINQVVNGVLGAKRKGQQSIVGVLPGGTANQWAAETSVPLDPVKAALALLGSNVRTVDIGRIQVQGLRFPNATQDDHTSQKKGKKAQKRKAKQSVRGKHYFLLTAGLGIDASVINHTSKTLKRRAGRFAFDLAAAEVLPTQHPFPIEVSLLEEDGQEPTVWWSGVAYQIVFGNTRRYANAVALTPEAYIDDGKLDLCVITEGNPLSTFEQITSLLFRHKLDALTAKHFRHAHFLITVPASICLQLDGSAVKLEDYLSKVDRKALRQVPDKSQVMVTYRFDALPHALRVAIPHTYDNTLFEHSNHKEEVYIEDQQHMAEAAAGQDDKPHEEPQRESPDLVSTLLEHGYKVKIAGVTTKPDKRHTSIVAGSTIKQRTGEISPVAVRIDEDTIALLQTGEHVPLTDLQKLQEGAVVIADGKKSKRGVIRTKHVVVPLLPI